MRFQPITDKKMLSLAEVRWGLKRGCDYSGSGNSEAEDSHVHHCYEIYLHISGDISFLINNHIYSMHSGDLMIARPGDVHLCIYHRPC